MTSLIERYIREEDRESAHTLQEMLVVILIIGILTAIAVPAFLNSRTETRSKEVITDVQGFSVKSLAHKKAKGIPPTSIAVLNAGIQSDTSGNRKQEFHKSYSTNRLKVITDGKNTMCFLGYNTAGGEYTQENPYREVMTGFLTDKDADSCPLGETAGTWE